MMAQNYKLKIFFVNKKVTSKNYYLILTNHQVKVFVKGNQRDGYENKRHPSR